MSVTLLVILGLAEPLVRALEAKGYETPTPIQRDAIPTVITGRDLLGIAQTGTGKTAAFALPILHRLASKGGRPPRGGCRVLVLSPTRELSGQILDSFNAYGRHIQLSAALAIGGVPMGRQVRSLMGGVDVLVATPGRLLDHFRQPYAKLDQLEFLVLDDDAAIPQHTIVVTPIPMDIPVPAGREVRFVSELETLAKFP